MSKISGILLAAGKSSRFGPDKLLYELTIAGIRQPLIQHTLSAWISAFDTLSVVIRTDTPLLRQTIQNVAEFHNTEINVIECQTATLGMGHSLSAAIAANVNADGWVIGLADMPLIPRSVLTQVHQNLILGADITAPYFEHRRGHPVGFKACYKDELLALKGDSGAKKLLERDIEKIHKIKTDYQGVLADIDYVNDVNMIERFSKS